MMALTSSVMSDDVPGQMQMTDDKAHSWDEWNATKMGVSGGMIHWGPQTINKYFFGKYCIDQESPTSVR